LHHYHTSFVRQSRRRAAPASAGSVFFYVHHDGRLRRCGITADALSLLATEIGGLSWADTPGTAFRRHKDWVRTLALLVLQERGDADGKTLMLTEADVRFQLACDATMDLPSVLCI
jgi:hypothetical protein